MNRVRIGIIGCGAMGSEIAKACVERMGGSLDLVAVCDIDSARAGSLSASLGGAIGVLGADELIRRVDLVVEAASASVSGAILEKCVKARKECLIMSVGGLLGKEALLKEAASNGVKVYIPSGALCGIDALRSASVGKIESVTLTTTKPPKGLEGAPYLKEHGIDLGRVAADTVIFEGSADEAVRGFPANVNVAAVLSLAGIGSAKTRVRIVASPGCTKNTHEVVITGDCGTITARTDNVPSKANPKTSALAIYSAIAVLEGIANPVRIGT